VHTGTFLGVPPTGATVEVDQALFARIENGRIDELWEIVDTGSGLRQLGVLGDQALGLDED
jgi:predicted ester cyclase